MSARTTSWVALKCAKSSDMLLSRWGIIPKICYYRFVDPARISFDGSLVARPLQTTVTLTTGQSKPLIAFGLNRFITEAVCTILACKHPDEIQAAIQSLKEKRLLPLVQNAKTQRVHDDLSRAFFRALFELRRQQQWRRQQSVILVEADQATETSVAVETHEEGSDR